MPSEAGRSIEASIVRLATVTGLLAASESRSSAILEHAAIGIWTIGIDGRIRSANAAAARHGRPRRRSSNAVGMLTEFLPAFDGEQLIRPTKGPSIPVLTQAVTVPAEPEPLLTVFARDISERKQFEEQLAHQARHDALTGLPNRFAVLEHLESVLMNGDDQCAVMFVDIDGFKSVNDSHGHATGDLVLREIADRIRGPGAARRLRGPSRRRRVPDRDARLRGHDDGRVVRLPTDPRDRAAVPLRRPPVRGLGERRADDPRTGLVGGDRGPAGRRRGVPRQAPWAWAGAALRPRPPGLDRSSAPSSSWHCGKRSATTTWSSTSSRSSTCSRASAGAPRRSCAGTAPGSARSRRRTSSPSPSAAHSSSTSSGGCCTGRASASSPGARTTRSVRSGSPSTSRDGT